MSTYTKSESSWHGQQSQQSHLQTHCELGLTPLVMIWFEKFSFLSTVLLLKNLSVSRFGDWQLTHAEEGWILAQRPSYHSKIYAQHQIGSSAVSKTVA